MKGHEILDKRLLRAERRSYNSNFSTECQSLDTEFRLNSFETKAVGFCKRAADVVVVQFFNKFFTARESNDRQSFKWMNSITFIVSLLAKHWTYQTLNQCINHNAVVNVVVFPIEKYKSAPRVADVVDIKFFAKVFRRKECADRQTVHE